MHKSLSKLEKHPLNKLFRIFLRKYLLYILLNLHIENEIWLILFIGGGKIDELSIILNDSVYVFIDLGTLRECNGYKEVTEDIHNI